MGADSRLGENSVPSVCSTRMTKLVIVILFGGTSLVQNRLSLFPPLPKTMIVLPTIPAGLKVTGFTNGAVMLIWHPMPLKQLLAWAFATPDDSTLITVTANATSSSAGAVVLLTLMVLLHMTHAPLLTSRWV